MANTTLSVKLLQAYDTETNWSTNDPVLLAGQMAISSDKNGMYKVGDGTSAWSALSYNAANTATSATSATSATKLATARTIRTNLASTSTASFNGTANITPGVTGTLPIGNGGTGTTTGHIAITAGTDTTSTASPAHGGTFTAIDGITKDDYGHVMAINTKTITLPTDNNTDTKVTNTLGTTTKAYITGTTSSTTNTGTQIFDTGVYLSTTAGNLVATTFTGALSGNATTATALATARTIRTNLASTSTASFNGTANVTPGVTGTLAVGNGGTGTTTGHIAITTSDDTTSTATATHGGTFTAVDSVTRDDYGHVTSVNTKTITLPTDNNTDTKVTNTLATTTKAYVTGTTSSSTNTGTQVFDTGVYLGTTAGTLYASTFSGSLSGNATTATTATKLGSSTVGGAAKPIYLSSGTATACSSTVGSADIPVYMSSGTITACGSSLAVSVTGNAATATTLATARTIEGASFDGSAAITNYATCDTAAATAAKVATCSSTFSLVTGARVMIKFTYANSASSATLNVNSTGAKSIERYGTTALTTYQWNAGGVAEFVYDGTNWVMVNGTTATTTYYGMVKLSSSTSSTSTSLAATPSAVKAAYDLANTANTAVADDVTESDIAAIFE